MRVLTREQKESLKRIYCRHDLGMSYLSFRRGVQYASYDDCIMVQWAGMWLGIETDGYTHS